MKAALTDLVFRPYTASRHSLEHAVQKVKECCKIACNHTPAASSANTPCLNYSIGLCLGKCLGGGARQFDEIMDRFIALLQGDDRRLYDEMERNMRGAASAFRF